jgi:hypothetical protein
MLFRGKKSPQSPRAVIVYSTAVEKVDCRRRRRRRRVNLLFFFFFFFFFFRCMLELEHDEAAAAAAAAACTQAKAENEQVSGREEGVEHYCCSSRSTFSSKTT